MNWAMHIQKKESRAVFAIDVMAAAGVFVSAIATVNCKVYFATFTLAFYWVPVVPRAFLQAG